jgi:RoxA-like, cytochrome c-like/PKD domain/Cytochrome D1 heme domain
VNRWTIAGLAALAVIVPIACGDASEPMPPVGTGGGTSELTAVAGEAIYAIVGESVSFDASASIGAQTYQWNFGDGNGSEAPGDSPLADHVYQAPGRHTAVVTVFDQDGFKHAASRLVSVTHPLVFQPMQSSTVASLPARQELVVVSPDSDELTRMSYDEEGTLVVAERYATADEPRTVTPWKQWAVVPCQAADELQLIPLEAGAPSLTVAMPPASRPFGVVGDEDALYVSLQASGQLARVVVANGVASLDQVFDGLPDARGVARLPDGRIAVTRWRSPDDEAFVFVLDPSDGSIAPWTLAFDDQLGSDTESGGVPSYLEQLLVSPTGLRAVVPSLQANIGQGLFVGDEPLSHETTVRAVISYIDMVGGSEQVELRKQFDDRGFASAGAMSSRGDYLFVAMRGSRSVDRIDLLSGGLSGSIVDVGFAPQGVALSPDDRFLFVDAYLSRELVAFDVSDLTSPPAAVSSAAIVSREPLTPVVLRGKQLFNDSFDTRLAKDGYIACAHCHLDGLEDHRTWDFTDRGEGLRNTISLVGRSGASPIHWSANFDEVQDFEHDIRGPFGGTGLMTDVDFATGTKNQTLGDAKAGTSADLDALAAYVESLTSYPPSPFRTPDGSLSPEAAAGKLLFEDPVVACTTCHAGPELHDSQFLTATEPLLHDVGTLGAGSGQRLGGPLLGIDTPGLHGVWASAPYLHDGSAPTLLAVLTSHNLADAHGVTSGLSPTELDDLVAYLQSLDGSVD